MPVEATDTSQSVTAFDTTHTAEGRRLEEDRDRVRYWKRWGPYLSERAWGSVREDYSPYGTAWDYFPHDHVGAREEWRAGAIEHHGRQP